MDKSNYKQQQFFSLSIEVEKLNKKLTREYSLCKPIQPKKPTMSKWLPDKEIIKKLLQSKKQ